MVEQASSPAEEEAELVEVARAHDRLEAVIWARHLEDNGMEVTLKRAGGLLHAVIYLGRIPVSVRVARKDQQRAQEYLKKFRFI